MSIVRVSWKETSAWFGAAIAGLLLTGCPGNKTAHQLPQPPPTQSAGRWSPDAGAARVRDLEREADNLSADSKLLPGNDPADHARLMQRVFTDLLQTLPLLANPGNDRVLAQRLTIIQNSRAQLHNDPASVAQEPAIDTGLRAASAALADISHGDNYEQADLGPMLDKLSARINRLDLERDPNLHRVDVADAVDLSSQVVSKLAAVLSGRITADGPSTAPATQPAPATGK